MDEKELVIEKFLRPKLTIDANSIVDVEIAGKHTLKVTYGVDETVYIYGVKKKRLSILKDKIRGLAYMRCMNAFG